MQGTRAAMHVRQSEIGNGRPRRRRLGLQHFRRRDSPSYDASEDDRSHGVPPRLRFEHLFSGFRGFLRSMAISDVDGVHQDLDVTAGDDPGELLGPMLFSPAGGAAVSLIPPIRRMCLLIADRPRRALHGRSRGAPIDVVWAISSPATRNNKSSVLAYCNPDFRRMQPRCLKIGLESPWGFMGRGISRRIRPTPDAPSAWNCIHGK